MGKLRKAQVAEIEKIGEDRILGDIMSGRTVRSLIADLQVGWRTFYMWVDSVEGRRDRYNDALQAAGHAYAARAVDTAQNATADNVNVARLQVDTDKWIAGKLNSKYDTKAAATNVTIQIEDLHAQAAALISDAVEGQYTVLDGDDPEDANGAV